MRGLAALRTTAQLVELLLAAHFPRRVGGIDEVLDVAAQQEERFRLLGMATR